MHPFRTEIEAMQRYEAVKVAWDDAKQKIQYRRKALRYVEKIKRGEATLSTVSRYLNDLHGRTNFTVAFGKVPNATVQPGSYRLITVTIGYMYQKRVWDKFYKVVNERPVTPWFLLSADQYRLNQKHIELYECAAYNIKAKEFRTVYASIASIGGQRKTFVNNTMQSVVKNAHDYIEDIVTKTLKGEAA